MFRLLERWHLFGRQRSIRVCIDPRKIRKGSIESFLLNRLFTDKQFKDGHFFEKHAPYYNQLFLKHSDVPREFLNNEIFKNSHLCVNIQIDLICAVIKRRRNKPTYKDEFRYLIIDPNQSDAVSRTIVKKTFELVPAKDSRFLQAKPNFLALIKRNNKDYIQQRMLLEDTTTINNHMGNKVKPFYEFNNTFYFPMEFFEGEDLSDKLNQLDNEQGDHTDELLKLSLETAWNVHQMHEQYGVIHNDLKPANIMHYHNKVKIIDFEGANIIGRNPRVNVNTAPYVAPELLVKTVQRSAKSDIFSFGMMLMDFWGCQWFFEMAKKSERTIVNERVNKNEMEKIKFDPSDFKDTSLSSKHKKQLQRIIKSMLCYDSKFRSDLLVNIKILENIRIERKIEFLQSQSQGLSDKIKTEIKFANETAIKLRAALMKSPVNEIAEKISDKLIVIGNDGLAIEEFVETLGIDAFKACKTKEEIAVKLKNIMKAYEANKEKLVAFENKLNTPDIDPVFRSSLLQRAFYLRKNLQFLIDAQSRVKTLDNIVAFNQKIDKNLSKLEAEYEAVFKNSLVKVHVDLIRRKDNLARNAMTSLIDNVLYFLERRPDLSLSKEQETFLIKTANAMKEGNSSKQEVDLNNNNNNNNSVDIKIVDDTNKDSLTSLKDDLKLAIAKYLTNTLVANIKTRDRAFSGRRQRNIEELLDKINKGESLWQLYYGVQEYADNKIRGGLFNATGFFSGSDLRKEIHSVLAEYAHHPEIFGYHPPMKSSKVNS